MELIPNLHLIEGRRSNIYLWLGDGGPVLIDAGMPDDAGRIVDYLAKIGLEVGEIEAIFVTHADLDHAGGVATIQEKSGAIIYAGSETASWLQIGKSPKHMPWLMQFVVDHFMDYRKIPAEVIHIIADGDMVLESGDWRAVATPGHTLDHFSFCSNVSGILFAGDALNTHDDRLQSTPKRMTADWPAGIDSARELLLLHPAVIACGHGRPFMNFDANVPLTLYRELGQENG